jgi:hypothetical protein
VRRPYLNSTIDDLERLVGAAKEDAAVLAAVAEELTHRRTPRAVALRSLVSRLRGAARPPARESSTVPNSVVSRPDPINRPEAPTKSENNPRSVQTPSGRTFGEVARPITNTPANILKTWFALEVLSPATFRRPADLAGAGGSVAYLKQGTTPWAGIGQKAKPGTLLFYHVILGSIDMSAATERLVALLDKDAVEPPRSVGRAAIATLTLDQKGRPVDQDPVSISSYAWALPQALRGDLSTLEDWLAEEGRLAKALETKLIRRDPDGRAMPVSLPAIVSAYKWLIEILDLPRDLVEEPGFATKSFPPMGIREPPEAPLLNSFFLEDIKVAMLLAEKDELPKQLRLYIGQDQLKTKRDLLNDSTAIEHAVRPAAMPAGRWPGPERRSLLLLQQAAVNGASDHLSAGGILAVNGPPGTGKTTLLRDLVADVVFRRAQAMAEFQDPLAAFQDSSATLTVNREKLKLYRISESISGFEVLVTSSNNKAVENVSTELPGINGIARDAPTLRYFPSIAEALADGESSWGMMAAVLGNAANVRRFKEVFWRDEEISLATYLQSIVGLGGLQSRSVVQAEQPPIGRAEAVQRWREARQRFEDAQERVSARLKHLEISRLMYLHWPATVAALEAVKAVDLVRPSFFARLFRTRAAREWRARWLACSTHARAEVSRIPDELADQSERRALQTAAGTKRWRDAHQDVLASSLLGRATPLRGVNRSGGISLTLNSSPAPQAMSKDQFLGWMGRHSDSGTMRSRQQSICIGRL